MSVIYQDSNVMKYLKIAELWGDELNTDMWTVARKMAEGTKGYKIVAQPLLIHHISMIDSDGNNTGKGGFQNENSISALNTLIEHKPDCPENIIVQGLHDMCITKQSFRLWCVEKYPLPKFWFIEEERNTFSPEEIVQIKRVGKLELSTRNNLLLNIHQNIGQTEDIIGSKSKFANDIISSEIEKRDNVLQEKIDQIASNFASRGFEIPPGEMFFEINKTCINELSLRYEIIWKTLLKVLEIQPEKNSLLPKEVKYHCKQQYKFIKKFIENKSNEYSAQFESTEYGLIELEQEYNRLIKQYQLETEIYTQNHKQNIKSSTLLNPLELKPNFYGFGIDLMKIPSWFNHIKNKWKK